MCQTQISNISDLGGFCPARHRYSFSSQNFNIFQHISTCQSVRICLESDWLWKAFEASLSCLRKIEPLPVRLMKQDSTGLRIGNSSLTMFDPSILRPRNAKDKSKARNQTHFIIPSLQVNMSCHELGESNRQPMACLACLRNLENPGISGTY